VQLKFIFYQEMAKSITILFWFKSLSSRF